MIAVFYIFFIEAFICYVAGIPSIDSSTLNTISLILLLINTIVVFIYIVKRYEEYSAIVTYALLLSLFLKAFLIIWDYYGTSIFILPNSHADSESYHYWAQQYALYGAQVDNYDLVVGTIYKYFGVQRITAQFFNALLSFAGISVLDRSLDIINVSQKIRDRTLIFAALLPNYLVISSILIRETVISFAISISCYFFLKWWKFDDRGAILLALLLSFSACYFHSGAIAITIGYAVAVVVTKKNEQGGRLLNISISSIILTIVFVIGFMLLFSVFSSTLLKKFGALTTETIDTYIEDHNLYGGAEQDSSKYYAGFSGFSGVLGILINSPIRMIYFLFVPMPWSIRGLKDLLAFLGSSLFYGGTVTVSLLCIGLKREINRFRPELMVFLLIALCSAFVFAWGTESAGTALRHREKFYFIYLVLFAVLNEYIGEENDLQIDSKGITYN